MKKILLTGAAGALGSRLRAPMAAMADELVSTDLAASVNDLAANESYRQADLADLALVREMAEGAEMIVHFGAIPDEAPFDDILKNNIVPAYNIWQAAADHGVRRVVYASSIHAVGMHPKTDVIGADCAHRPDGFYGLAKCFAEDVARMYWDKEGVEAVCLRILSCTEPVKNTRAVGSWLSYRDMVHLVERSVSTPVTGFLVAYGVSNNDRSPVDNSAAAVLGYRPQDNAEEFAKDLFASAPTPDPSDPAQMTHGGPFASVELGVSGVSMLKKMG